MLNDQILINLQFRNISNFDPVIAQWKDFDIFYEKIIQTYYQSGKGEDVEDETNGFIWRPTLTTSRD